MRKVFTNDMVAHVWAQQTQEEGRSGNGNFYFDGTTIYSYGRHFPIARFTNAYFNGARVVLFSSDSYSVSTARHKRYCESALRGLSVKIFYVPQVSEYGERGHALNVESYVSALRSHAAEMAKPRKRYWQYQVEDTMQERIASLDSYVVPIREYCEAFGLAVPKIDDSGASKLDLPKITIETWLESLSETIRQAYAKHNDPKRVKAREKSAANRERKIAAAMSRFYAWREGVLPKAPAIVSGMDSDTRRAIKYARYDLRSDFYSKRRSDEITIAEWHSGKGYASQNIRDHDSYRVTLVRKRGDRLETSRGADVPFEQAVAAFLFAARCRRKAESWQRNGQQFRVGQFQLDSVDAAGNIRAGCHTLQWPEMLRLAVKEIPDMVRPTYPVPAIVA